MPISYKAGDCGKGGGKRAPFPLSIRDCRSHSPMPHSRNTTTCKRGEEKYKPIFSLHTWSQSSQHTYQVLFDPRHSCSCETEARVAFSFRTLFLKSVLLSDFFRSSQAAHESVDAPYAAESWRGRRASEHWQTSIRRSWYFNSIACDWRWKSFPVSASLEESFLFYRSLHINP